MIPPPQGDSGRSEAAEPATTPAATVTDRGPALAVSSWSTTSRPALDPGSGTTAGPLTEPAAGPPAAEETSAGPAPPGPPVAPADAPQFDDFEVLGLLGEGAFARVYLARQVSLDRLVALKVSDDLSQEARTMARLEHDHIVQVYSEAVDAARGLRLICMRYVPGTTLDRVIRELGRGDRGGWDGRSFLAAIDALSARRGEFDPTAFRDREALGQADRVEVVAWVGARLAEALAHAHRSGVLHRDVKPANILITTYGRPLLTDFNVASSPHHGGGRGDGPFGGTLATMAPEHLDALNPAVDTTASAVDERSDVYSLGVVLFQLLAGRRPFRAATDELSRPAALSALARERRAEVASVRRVVPAVPEFVDRVIGRCLDPDPARRYQSASELARALDGCRELQGIGHALPPADRLTRAAIDRPFTLLILLTVAPHLVGSCINIAYNATQVVGGLSRRQQASFAALALGYNVVVYGLCLGLAIRLIGPSLRDWRTLQGSGPMDAGQAAAARRRALALPLWAVVLSCLGWLPGGVLFPASLSLTSGPAEPVGGAIYGHFLVSFWIAGLIALTYAFFGAQLVALRVLYPRLWVDPRDVRGVAARELAAVERRHRVFQVLAALIPLASAALLIGLGPGQMSRSFRVLTTGLIVVGMAGIGLAHAVVRTLTETLAAMTGAAPRARVPHDR